MSSLKKLFVWKKGGSSHGKLAVKASATDLEDASCSMTVSTLESDRKTSKKKRASAKKRSSSKPRRSGSNVSTGKESASANNKNSRTANEQAIDKWLAAINRHVSMEEMLTHWTSPDCVITLEDNPPLNATFLVTEVHKINLSFPNIQFAYESAKEVKPGVVLIDELCVTGTHTGVPYAFAGFPAIPANNKHVVLDPERCYFTMNQETGKIDRLDVIALGNLTGPPGMYLGIGGSLEMPPPTSESAEQEEKESTTS